MAAFTSPGRLAAGGSRASRPATIRGATVAYPPQPELCLYRAIHVESDDLAEDFFRAARERGANDELMDYARESRKRRVADDVTVIHSVPTPRCKCSHPSHVGLCPWAVCGCRAYRPQEVSA